MRRLWSFSGVFLLLLLVTSMCPVVARADHEDLYLWSDVLEAFGDYENSRHRYQHDGEWDDWRVGGEWGDDYHQYHQPPWYGHRYHGYGGGRERIIIRERYTIRIHGGYRGGYRGGYQEYYGGRWDSDNHRHHRH